MNQTLPVVNLVRYADTAWTLTGRHTSRNDLRLTTHGERQALAVRWIGLSWNGRVTAAVSAQ